MNFKDYYLVLEITTQATTKEIARAYKSLAKKWHPDINNCSNSTEIMQLITEAYEVLSNTEKRTKYNLDYIKHYQLKAANLNNSKTNIALCYYCGKNIAQAKFSYNETLYKETERKHFPKRAVSYKTMVVEIPRCEQCYKFHRSGSKTLAFLPIVAFTILGLTLGLTLWGKWLLFLFIGFICGVVIGIFLSHIDDLIIAKEAGIKKESDLSQFWPVISFKREGWTKNEPTA